MNLSQIVTAAVAFVGTTIDDLVVLAALFMARRASGRPLARVIIAGQYVGFAVVLAVALAAAAGLQIVSDRWVGLFALVPIGFGAWGLWRLHRHGQAALPVPASTVAGIATLTLANGVDNLTVFAPLFRSLHPVGALWITAMFFVLIGIWCAIGALIGGSRAVVATLAGATGWLVPAVFITVGVLILTTSGTLCAIWQTR